MGGFKLIGKKVGNFVNDESGATAIEYSLLAAIMGIGIIISLRILEDELSSLFIFIKDGVKAVFTA